MPASWPSVAETYRIDAINAAQSAIQAATDARIADGYIRRAHTADCAAELAIILTSMENAKRTKPDSGQWPQFAKSRRDLAIQHVEYARRKLAGMAGADPDLQAALLAEVAALCADVIYYLTAAA